MPGGAVGKFVCPGGGMTSGMLLGIAVARLVLDPVPDSVGCSVTLDGSCVLVLEPVGTMDVGAWEFVAAPAEACEDTVPVGAGLLTAPLLAAWTELAADCEPVAATDPVPTFVFVAAELEGTVAV